MLNRCRAQLGFGSHPNRILQQEWSEYGPEAFEFEVLALLGIHNDFIEISQKNLSRINNINETKVKQLLDYYKERNKITFFMVHGIVCYKIVGFNKLHNKWQVRKEKKLSTNEENPALEAEVEVEEEKIKEREKRRKCGRNYEAEAQQILEAFNKATDRCDRPADRCARVRTV